MDGRRRVHTPKPPIPSELEEYRDACWRREATRHIDSASDAERFIEQVGFAACLTDSRRPGPSLYVAVCGRRDAVMPRHVQKDLEASLTWRLKDEIVKRVREERDDTTPGTYLSRALCHRRGRHGRAATDVSRYR